jgi:hypothetical protein
VKLRFSMLLRGLLLLMAYVPYSWGSPPVHRYPIEIFSDVLAMRFHTVPISLQPTQVSPRWTALMILQDGSIVDAARRRLGYILEDELKSLRISKSSCADQFFTEINESKAPLGLSVQAPVRSYWVRPTDGDPFEVAMQAHGRRYILTGCSQFSKKLMNYLDFLAGQFKSDTMKSSNDLGIDLEL